MITQLVASLRKRMWIPDTVAGLAMLGALTVAAAGRATPTDEGLPAPVVLGWLMLGAIPIGLRRQRPWWATWLVTVYGVLPQVIPHGQELAETDLPHFVVAYTLAVHLPLLPALAGTVLIWGSSTAASVYAVASGDPTTGDLPLWSKVGLNLILVALLLAVGRVVGRRRRRADATRAALLQQAQEAEAARRTLALRAEEAETHQRALADQAVAAERQRMAQELHDVVGHHLNVVSVLGSGARRALAHNPQAADQALATIEDTGRTGLREMRHMLRRLREEPGQDHLDHTSFRQLADRAATTGLAVTLTCDPHLDQIEPQRLNAGYRVVQEALTNILKHAQASTVDITVARTGGDLSICVVNDARPHAEAPPTRDSPGKEPAAEDHDGSGQGLPGMRQRVSVFGGTLDAGPDPTGGFRVTAHIPGAPPPRTPDDQP